MPFAGCRPDYRIGIELAAIDPHRAAEAAADIECRLDDGVTREARRDRFGECQEFRAGLGMIGAKEPDDATPQRTSYS